TRRRRTSAGRRAALNARSIVRRWSIETVDDQDVNGRTRRFQLQSKLLPERSRQRRSCLSGRGKFRGRQLIDDGKLFRRRRIRQGAVVQPCQSGLVEDR